MSVMMMGRPDKVEHTNLCLKCVQPFSRMVDMPGGPHQPLVTLTGNPCCHKQEGEEEIWSTRSDHKGQTAIDSSVQVLTSNAHDGDAKD